MIELTILQDWRELLGFQGNRENLDHQASSITTNKGLFPPLLKVSHSLAIDQAAPVFCVSIFFRLCRAARGR
jgi:hypothetical protein